MAPLTVTVEINPQSDPISGHVINAGLRRPFCGWLEFAAALQAAMNTCAAEEVSGV
jgi:hypothetical protein